MKACVFAKMEEFGESFFFTGWWLGHPSEKYESVGMMKFSI